MLTDNRILKDAIDKIFYNDFPAIVSEEEYGKSADNRRAIKLLQESIYFDEEKGKFVVALPWKYGRERLAEILNAVDSKAMALKRLRSMIPKLQVRFRTIIETD